MKYLKRTGLSWWRGGGGSLLSLHPKTQALHTPPQLPAPVILGHTPLPSQRAAPTSNKPHPPPPAPHMDTPLLSPHACISGPPSYTSTCTHTLSPHTGIQVSLPLHTYAHARPHPFSPLCTCMHTRTHTHTHTPTHKAEDYASAKRCPDHEQFLGRYRPNEANCPGRETRVPALVAGPGAFAQHCGWPGRRCPSTALQHLETGGRRRQCAKEVKVTL